MFESIICTRRIVRPFTLIFLRCEISRKLKRVWRYELCGFVSWSNAQLRVKTDFWNSKFSCRFLSMTSHSTAQIFVLAFSCWLVLCICARWCGNDAAKPLEKSSGKGWIFKNPFLYECNMYFRSLCPARILQTSNVFEIFTVI